MVFHIRSTCEIMMFYTHLINLSLIIKKILMKWDNFIKFILELSKIHIASFSSLSILFVSSMNHSPLKQMKAAFFLVSIYWDKIYGL